MGLYRIELNAYNSRANYPGARIVVFVRGIDPTDACRRLGTGPSCSETGVVTLDGGVGGMYGARGYGEWEIVSTRKLPDDGNGVTRLIGLGQPYRRGTVAGYVAAYAECGHTVANSGNTGECCTGSGARFRAMSEAVTSQ